MNGNREELDPLQKHSLPDGFLQAFFDAFKYSLKLAANYSAKVHALHVVAPVIPSTYGGPFSVADMTAALKKRPGDFFRKPARKANKLMSRSRRRCVWVISMGRSCVPWQLRRQILS